MSKSDDKPLEINPMRRLLGNIWLLARGRGVAAVMALGSIALMARALGPAEFGMVVLIQSYFLLMRGLLNFRAFEAVIRFGVPAHDSGDLRLLRRLIKVCRRVDHRASIAATALALSLAPLLGPLMGMDHDHVVLLAAYSLVLLTTNTSTAGGILRLFDLFDVLGKLMAIDPTIRFVGAVIAWWFDSPLWVFIAILAFSMAAANLYSLWLCRQVYRQRIGRPPEGESIHDATLTEFPGLRHFLWITYWQSNMDTVPKHITTMLTGNLLGPTEAGLLRLARDFSSLLAKPAVIIREVAFPDLTRSWNQGSNAFELVTYRIALLSGGFGMLFVLVGYLFGDVLLGTLIGKEFAVAAPVLTLLLLASTFDLSASSLRAAAYAIGCANKVLRMYVVSIAVYMTLFILLTQWMGLIGAGVAACVAAALPLLFLVALIHSNTSTR